MYDHNFPNTNLGIVLHQNQVIQYSSTYHTKLVII